MRQCTSVDNSQPWTLLRLHRPTARRLYMHCHKDRFNIPCNFRIAKTKNAPEKVYDLDGVDRARRLYKSELVNGIRRKNSSNVASNLKISDSGKNIKSKLELASFRILHGTTDTSRCETAVVPRSSKHGHGVPGCVCEVLTTARQSIVCGRARPARPHD